MKEYQVYILHEDGHIKSRTDLSCENDEEAKKRAQQLVDGHAIELWQQARKIVKFEPEK